MTVTLESLVRYSPALTTNGKGTAIVNGNGYAIPVTPSVKSTNLLASFIESYKQIETYRYASYHTYDDHVP